MQVYWHNFRPISFNFFIPSIPIPISIDSFHIISHVSLLFIDCTLYPLKSISECSLLTAKKFLAMCNQAARQAPSFSAPSTNIPPFPPTTDIRRATLRFAAAQCYATLILLSLSLSLSRPTSTCRRPTTNLPPHPPPTRRMLQFYALDPTVLRVFCVHRRFIRVRRLLARRVPLENSESAIKVITVYYIKL